MAAEFRQRAAERLLAHLERNSSWQAGCLPAQTQGAAEGEAGAAAAAEAAAAKLLAEEEAEAAQVAARAAAKAARRQRQRQRRKVATAEDACIAAEPEGSAPVEPAGQLAAAVPAAAADRNCSSRHAEGAPAQGAVVAGPSMPPVSADGLAQQDAQQPAVPGVVGSAAPADVASAGCAATHAPLAAPTEHRAAAASAAASVAASPAAASAAASPAAAAGSEGSAAAAAAAAGGSGDAGAAAGPPGEGMGEDLLSELCCPITTEPMDDPVLAADGETYERSAIAGRQVLAELALCSLGRGARCRLAWAALPCQWSAGPLTRILHAPTTPRYSLDTAAGRRWAGAQLSAHRPAAGPHPTGAQPCGAAAGGWPRAGGPAGMTCGSTRPTCSAASTHRIALSEGMHGRYVTLVDRALGEVRTGDGSTGYGG